MASFDIVNKVDPQLLENAVNVTRKEITTRFDFRDKPTEIELNKKDLVVHIATEHAMGIESIEDVLLTRSVKQGLDGRCYDFSKEAYPSGKMMKKDIKVKSGIDRDTAKKVVKMIKDSKIKVDAAIMDDQVRVTGKKIDDLQAVIAMLRKAELDVPLQFQNMKS